MRVDAARPVFRRGETDRTLQSPLRHRVRLRADVPVDHGPSAAHIAAENAAAEAILCWSACVRA